jgi:hypothetical protein
VSRLVPTLRRRDVVQFAELHELRRPAQRTALLRAMLMVALGATLTGLVLVARSAGAGRAAVLPSGVRTGIVVLDMSASISGPVYARIATVLRSLADANQSIGLVMFSDTAYELLPPNSPPGALAGFITFFVPTRYVARTPIFPPSPWDTFSGGTRLSRGLVEAEHDLRTAHVQHGAILIVSDIDDSSDDRVQLMTVALRLHREHIPIRIAPLFASVRDKRYMAALFGSHAFLSPRLFVHRARHHVQSVTADPPLGLIALGLVLVFLLAANERWNGRLVVRA